MTNRFVSTGHLPDPERARTLVEDAHTRLRGVGDGRPSDVYPALSRVDPDLFGVAVVGVNGARYAVPRPRPLLRRSRCAPSGR